MFSFGLGRGARRNLEQRQPAQTRSTGTISRHSGNAHFLRVRSHFGAMAVSSQIEISVQIERHYAVTEIAEMWNLSADKVRDLFEDEPGVLMIGERNPRRKRRYVTLRIPRSVLERVRARLSSNVTAR